LANDKAAEGAAPKKKLVKGRHVSAMKRARQSLRRQERNVSWQSRVKTFEKKVITAVQKKDVKLAKEALVEFMSQIDKAAQKGAVHARRAARRIGRLSKQVASLHP
jgi:small subunit ribosomal protein S20